MPADERVLYFAYGSNLDAAQMLERCGEVRSVGPATLAGYRLAFGGRSTSWEGQGVATVLPDSERTVSGFLFELGRDGLARLDRFEGHPRAYRRKLVKIERWAGPVVDAWVYLKRPERFRPNAPSERYLAVIRREYERHGFDLTALEAAVREAA